MDAFESIVALFLEKKGYWVQKSVKVRLTADEKASIGGRSMPTPEVDLVAFNPTAGLILIEVKSFLDSGGVTYYDLSGTGKYSSRYKLLNNSKYRDIIGNKVCEDFIARGLILKETAIKFGLAAGNTFSGQEEQIKDFLKAQNDIYFSPADIRQEIRNLSSTVYLNDTATLVVKLLKNYLKP